ncbi:MAG TPA: dTDP-glucose 4,6-dehydratase [Bacteroidota bacterium]|jgi:dTDP-glucose 4,6-dehydratase|nr:dTDP-glucose 4,6-dehydratase [Bacteroidota bacterium]
MQSLLVTGGAGFIGSNFVRYMLNKYLDYRIIVLDALTYAGNLENLKEFEKNPRFIFLHGDIRDEKAVDNAVRNVDVIVNFAAETFVDRSIHGAADFIQTDVHGTYVLLEAAKKYKIERYIQISTDEVYGSIDSGSFTEESPINPNNPYSASKAGGDMLVRSYYITYGLPVITTRASNNFGPYQFPEKLIPLFVTNAIDNLKLPLYGDGQNVRDWLYVLDHCKAIDIILHKGKIGEVYNIGGGNEKSNIEITKYILNYLGKPESLIQRVQDRLGHDRRYSINSSKLKSLGWQPEYNFESALRDTIEWYVKNEKWWRELKEKNRAFKEFYQKNYNLS